MSNTSRYHGFARSAGFSGGSATNRFVARLGWLSAAIAVASLSSPAQAQAGAQVTRIPQLEEIVVRGQKRDQSLRDVNASVAVFTGDMVSDLTFTDVSELYQFTPNVQATTSDEGDFSIRGINFRGENLSLTSNVGSMYVDGIFQSTLGIEAGPSGIFDIEQVEIYRGVQSTIQGRNALAGAVVIRTADPTYEWAAKGRVEYADYDTTRWAVAVGGPVVDDQVAFRASWDEYESDGFLENPAAGIDDINFDDTRNRRLKVLVEPDFLEGFSALVTYVDSEGYAGTGFGTNVANGPDFFDRETRPDVTSPTLLEIDTENWAVELSQAFSENLTVEFIYTNSDAEEEGGPRFGSFDENVFFDFATDEEEVDTWELRGIWAAGGLRLIGGLYYFEQDRERVRDLGLPPSDIFFIEGVTQEIENAAVYFDGEYTFSEEWTLLFGARYDDESFDETGVSAFSPAGPIEPGDLVANSTDTDYDAFLPKLGVRWNQSDNLSWSFVAQRGYRAGGAAIDGNNNPYEFDPEYTNNFEFALRSVLLDGRLNLNANLFYIDWEDQQVTVQTDDPSGLVFITDNAGESELYGLEIDISASLTDRLTLIAGVGLLHTEFEDFSNAATGEDFSGNSFSQAPEETFNLGLFYEHGNGIYGSFDARYVGDAYSDSQNIEEHELGSYVLANAKVGFRSANWSAAVFARNVFDEDYLLRVRNLAENPENPELWEGTVGAPRVIGGELTFNF